MNIYSVIGVMSGTSCDGLDLAYCSFYKTNKWNYKIVIVKTYSYTEEWKKKFDEAKTLNIIEFLKLHKEYGYYIGQIINSFLREYRLPKPDLISSHGHTIFHQPEIKFNFQLGDSNIIAAETQITTVSDFRTLDIVSGGQGAPLVPIGDMFLFSKFDFCLNLGGFANMSYDLKETPKAYDICACNLITNYLSQKKGFDFDKSGEIGKKGNINQNLLDELNNLEYFNQLPPKSLGKEWLVEKVIPIIEKEKISVEDKLRTVYEHIAIQIDKSTLSSEKKSIFVTGGGAYNKFLIKLIKQKTNNEIIIPSYEFVEFKEAIIFGLLGVLRYRKEINCLASVTGSERDNSVGTVVFVK